MDESNSSHCAYDIDGGDWILVRHTYNKWFSATDGLSGSANYGVESGPLSDNEFGISFKTASDDTEFLFSRGDCERWLITTYDQIAYPRESPYDATITKSSFSDDSYTAEWYNRAKTNNDPMISGMYSISL